MQDAKQYRMSVLNDKRILVIGGTGFVGSAVTKGLMEAGYPVRLLARNPEKARRIFGDRADIVRGDVTSPESLAVASTGCYGVFISLHGYKGKGNFFRVEHWGVENVATAAADAGVKQIIMISGANVSPDATAYFIKAKYLGEQALLNGPVPAMILRCSWFMESLPMMIKGPLAVVVGRQPHPIHFIAFEDLIRMVSKVYAAPETSNKTIQAYGPETRTVHEALKKYCAAFAPWRPVVHLPLWAFWIVSRLLGGQFPFLYDLLALTNRDPEPPDSGEATTLMGPNTTTLAQWIEEKRGESP